MKYIKFLLALLTAAMLPATAPAQNYSLRELLQEGLQNSYSLKIVRNDEQTAANNNTLANAGALPTVSLSAGYSGALDNTKTKERGTGLLLIQPDLRRDDLNGAGRRAFSLLSR